MERLVERIVRFRVPLLLLLLAVTAASTVVVARGLRFDFSPRALFLTHDEEIEYLAGFRSRFGEEDASFLVLLHAEPDRLWSAEGIGLLRELTARMQQLPHVASVVSLAGLSLPLRQEGAGISFDELLPEGGDSAERFADARRRALQDPLVVGRLVNSSADTLAIVVTFEEEFETEPERRPVLDEADRVVEELVVPPFSGHAIGLPQVQREYATLLPRDLVRNSAMSIVLISALLWFLFRDPVAVGVANLAVGMALSWMLALMVLLGHPVNLINSVIVSLVLVIGVSEAVHMIARFREKLAQGLPPQEALRKGIAEVAVACLLTALTSAVGFASLATASITVVRALGWFAGAGILSAFVTSILLVPIAYSWVSNPGTRGFAAIASEQKGGWTTSLGDYVTSPRGRRAIWGVTVLLFVASGVGISRLDANNFMLEEMWPRNRTQVATAFAEEHLGGLLPVEVEITAQEEGGVLDPAVLRGMIGLQEWFAEEGYVRHGQSLADVVAEAHELASGERGLPDSERAAVQDLFLLELAGEASPVGSFVDMEHRHARISTSARDWGSDYFFEWLDRVEREAKLRFPDSVRVHVTGAVLIANRALRHIVKDTFTNLSTAFVIITLMMTILFRSVRIGLVSMIPNVLPLAVTLGFMGFTGITIRTSMVLIFSLSIGIAVDDTIHIMTRCVQEVARDGDLTRALRRTLDSTGRAITLASGLLIAGFGVFITSSFFGLFQFGYLGALTLTSALLADVFLTPVIIQTVGLGGRGRDRATHSS